MLGHPPAAEGPHGSSHPIPIPVLPSRGGTPQGCSPQEKRVMEAPREGLAWGWLRARRGLGQARVPLAAGSLGVIYGHGGVLRSPSPVGSVFRRRVGSCR